MRRATGSNRWDLLFPKISIHALREESDGTNYARYAQDNISIHALREESDTMDLGDGARQYISTHARGVESDVSASNVGT